MLAYRLEITGIARMNCPMTPEIRFKLKEMLIKHEGYCKYPYTDSVGKITVGVGYNLSDRGLPDRYINELLNDDMDFFYQKLSGTFPWFNCLNDPRKIVLLNMCYNLGWKGFLSFQLMIGALSVKDYEIAACEMLDSKWAKQVGQRAIELAYIMEEGLWPS